MAVFHRLCCLGADRDEHFSRAFWMTIFPILNITFDDEFKGLQQGGGGLNHQAVWNNVLFFLFF